MSVNEMTESRGSQLHQWVLSFLFFAPVVWITLSGSFPWYFVGGFARLLEPAEARSNAADEALAAFLAASSPEARRARLAAFGDARLEPAGTGPALNRSGYDHKLLRAQFERLSKEIEAGFAAKRGAEMVPLVAAGHRLARIVSRGRPGDLSLKMRVAAAQAQQLVDEAVLHAGRRGQLAGVVPALESVYSDSLARETGIEPAMLADLHTMQRLVRWYDASLLWMRAVSPWDNPARELEQAIANVETGKPIATPHDQMHPVLAARWMKFDAIRLWFGNSVKQRRGILASLPLVSETPRDARGL